MQKKWFKYIAAIAVFLLVAFNSVYIKKLDEVKAAATAKTFDATAYAKNFFHKKLLPRVGESVEINTLIAMVQMRPSVAFESYSYALGIGNTRYFMVKGEGIITAINENDVTVLVQSDSAKNEFNIATEFVYGNAIRDAPGIIDINAFNSTMDFNNVSAEINRIIRGTVLPAFKTSVKKGDKVKFAGAIELNREHINTSNIEVVPIRLEIVQPVSGQNKQGQHVTTGDN